ncbi:VWA domain-containing protein [Limibaculum sp. M0105]|uniref:VWA domain-containing protein n=1 Tax=Thermohalobaculum xanthum TaxID=2753746 RepID=A0A8J7M6I0_9RHOB|nr:VWA domain-containing protein [Thermohalobaculum xanthum]MBK0399476.1 VWA domain-containing protein [Thermohalobaculum xanthum]
MRTTRFPARASGIAERVAGFIAHLRLNGIVAGPGETADALAALGHVAALDPAEARLAFRAVLAHDVESAGRFDDLFDAYWFNAGRTRGGEEHRAARVTPAQRPALWRAHFGDDATTPSPGAEATGPDDNDSEADGTDGRLIATRTRSLVQRDLRGLMDPEILAAAERVAHDLARCLRDRRSRRRRAAKRGAALDLRRVLRRSLARGGEPLDLFRRRRPDRAMRIVALCDVSGSMTAYARVFLAFLKGLIDADTTADAYLFHTRLMRVTPAMRDRDPLRAAARLSLMAEGFGGGTNIAGAIGAFCDAHAARAVNGRTVVLILSDGYCTGTPGELAAALQRLGRRAGRIVWLNPLAGWQGYEPVARGMAAARPHLDALLPANSIASLAALEPEFAKL